MTDEVLKLSGKMIEVSVGATPPENETLLQVLMRRDGLSEYDAKCAIEEARDRVLEDGDDPETVLMEEFGLEPDYVFDLLGDTDRY